MAKTLEELHFKQDKSEIGNILQFSKDNGEYIKYITFWLDTKQVTFNEVGKNGLDESMVMFANMQTLEATVLKCKELGWVA